MKFIKFLEKTESLTESLPDKAVRFGFSAKAKPRKPLGTTIHNYLRPSFRQVNDTGSHIYKSLKAKLKIIREQMNRIFITM